MIRNLLGNPFGTPGKKNRKGGRESAAITKARMQVRVVILGVLVAVIFAVLISRLWYLQVLSSDDFTVSAEQTYTREVKVPAQRGMIYDRDGEVLVDNVPGLNVTVVPSAIEREKLGELAGILEADEDRVLGLYDAAMESGSLHSPILVKEEAGRDAVTYVSERTREYPGLSINDDYTRNYPVGETAAHVLGYTGAITEEELAREDYEGFDNDAIVGKSGVELEYESLLHGTPGAEVYNVDAQGRIVGEDQQLDAMGRVAGGENEEGEPPDPELAERIEEPVPGRDLTLTVDLDLQQTVEEELDEALVRAREEGYDGQAGAALVMDPEDGEVLAMASRPDFDPQLFVGGITGAEEQEEYEYLTSEEAGSPFSNRAVSGTYPAASTFKAFTGMAGLAFDAIDPSSTFTDTGECWRPRGATEGCWQSWRQFLDTGTNHGTQDYEDALADSNDKFFYEVADLIWNGTSDPNLLPEFYERFGFGQRTGVDLGSEEAGRVPDREWQQEAGQTEEDRYWSVGRWVNLSIGQGDLLVTPLQLARSYAALENGGTLVTPHVAREAGARGGRDTEDLTPEPAGSVEFTQQEISSTVDGLRAVTEPGGTAVAAFEGSPLSVIGKTGTGEMGERDPVGWFVGWAEAQEEPVVVLVMVEGAGGDQVAAPAVRGILEARHTGEESPGSDVTPVPTESAGRAAGAPAEDNAGEPPAAPAG